MITLLLFDLAVIIAAAHAAGYLIRRMGQPPVVGELVAGVLLGIVMLSEPVREALLPPDVSGALLAVGQVGLVLYMFTVGYEFDHSEFGRAGKAALGVAVGALVIPLLGGAIMAVWLVSRHQPESPGAFIAFIAVATATTALPVLARILRDWRLSGTPVGGLALAGGTLVDVVAWGLLAFVVLLSGNGSGMRLLLVIPFFLVIIFVVRPLSAMLLPRLNRGGGAAAFVVAGLLLCAASTDWLGLHTVFGALIFGALLARRRCGDMARQVEEVTRASSIVLLPVFFVMAGMSVDLHAVGSAGVLELLVVLTVAAGSKLLGVYFGARLGGFGRSDSGVVAILMNARGATEIVLLQVGLELGIIDGALYSVLVLMALLTTIMTGPLLTLWQRRDHKQPEAVRV